METVRVNMTPNNEVKTIHCSQNDGKTRKWGFELYKEDGAISSSSIEDQMIFDAYKGGTEQILPENASIPTTSPIIADIQYPDAMRSDQEFLYRESPTAEDGQAKITKIKGNTIPFNQLVQNGDFANTDGWNVWRGSISASDNILTYTVGEIGTSYVHNRVETSFTPIIGHKYFVCFSIKPKTTNTLTIRFGGVVTETDRVDFTEIVANAWNDISAIVTSSVQANTYQICFNVAGGGYSINDTIQLKNCMIFDLTAMLIDSYTTTSQVKNWLSSHIGNLPYYDYTVGSLISFNGTGLKTVNADETEDSTLSLPISTYFPTGMKRAGNIFDELTENKATTRIGSRAYQSGDESDTSVITDGTTTYYPLTTPTETDITTASLVTDNGETPLYYDDDILKADCLTALSSEAGIFDAKIKLVDSETVYSQKIQLHVERKP